MCEEVRSFSSHSLERKASFGLTTHITLELPHHPRFDRQIDVSHNWSQRRWSVSPVVFNVFNPTQKEWIELVGNIVHRHMSSASDVQLPNRRSDGRQRRGADRRKKTAESLGCQRRPTGIGRDAIHLADGVGRKHAQL